MSFSSLSLLDRRRPPGARFRGLRRLGIALALFGLVRCAASGAGPSTDGATGGAPIGGGGRSDVNIDIVGKGTGGTLASEQLDALCGTGECVPDDASGCGDVPPSWGGEGGLGGASSGMAGLSASPGDLENATLSCQLGDGPSRSCQKAGFAGEGAPCLSVADCQAGLACVGEGPTGVCRNYCCRGTDASCSDDTYCAPRPRLGDQKQLVPVCVPVENCSLTEPYPCEAGQECTCSGDLACIVVRRNGRTACTTPGAGTAGSPCDPSVVGECAHGHVCSAELGCLLVCETLVETTGCQEGELCQTPSGFPPDLGVCVGGGAPATR